MVITNNDIENALFNYGDFVNLTANDIDLSSLEVIRALGNLTQLKIIIRNFEDFVIRKNNNPSGYEQLCALLSKCENLVAFDLILGKSLSADFGEAFEILMGLPKIERINIMNFSVNYSKLFELLSAKEGKIHVHLTKFANAGDELSYAISDEKIKRTLFVASFTNAEYEELSKACRMKKIPLKLYKKYQPYLTELDSYSIVIGNVSELDIKGLEELKKDSKVKNILVRCGYANSNEQSGYYTIQEYYQIRTVIDEIISNIKIPDTNNPNREKIIFAQLYKIIGKSIHYDHVAVSEEGKKDEELQNDCRNLKNGLLGVMRDGKKEHVTVCAGYATILQNICACLNIKCDYISSHSKVAEDPNVLILRGPIKYENGTNDPMGHGYNSVCLDGQMYLCDLTWDRYTLQVGSNCPSNFLKSYDDFCANHRDVGFSLDNVKVIGQDGLTTYQLEPSVYSVSLPLTEISALFGEIVKGNVEELANTDYLAGFVSECLNYAKQMGSLTFEDYSRILENIQNVENYILSDEFKKRAGWAGLSADVRFRSATGEIVDKGIIFYDGSSMKPEDAQSAVERESGLWKTR